MPEKLGSRFVEEMIGRGQREIGGFLFPESNIAQPTYPLRGGYAMPKEVESPTLEEQSGSVLDKHLERIALERDNGDRGKDDRGIDRE
jgi:hypothetical protein